MIKTLKWFSRLNQEKPRIQSWHSFFCFCSSITSSSKVRSWYVQYQCFESESEVDFQCFRLLFVISAEFKLMISTFKTFSLLSLHSTSSCSCAYDLENLRRACRHLSSNQTITARKRSTHMHFSEIKFRLHINDSFLFDKNT